MIALEVLNNNCISSKLPQKRIGGFASPLTLTAGFSAYLQTITHYTIILLYKTLFSVQGADRTIGSNLGFSVWSQELGIDPLEPQLVSLFPKCMNTVVSDATHQMNHSSTFFGNDLKQYY